MVHLKEKKKRVITIKKIIKRKKKRISVKIQDQEAINTGIPIKIIAKVKVLHQVLVNLHHPRDEENLRKKYLKLRN